MRESRIAQRFGHPAHMPRQARCLSVRVWHHPARVRATRDLVKVITMAIHPGAQCTAPRDLELARGVLPGAESPERVAHVHVSRGQGPTDGYMGSTGQPRADAPQRQVTLEGTLTVSCPGGPVDVRALFDTGSEADAVSIEKATELRQHGVSWGESGGNLRVADSG